MDWLRRNWPDLLIGVALVAVIAGIIATLISGGSFFPFGQSGGGTTPTPQPTTPATGPSTPGGTQPGAAQPGTTQPSATQPGSTLPGATQPVTPELPDDASAAGPSVTPGTGPAEPGPVTPTDEGIAVLPPPGSATQPATPAAPAAPAGADEAPGSVTALPPSGVGTTETPSTAPAAPATPSAQPPAAASADAEEASYRVSVGAFGNADNAQRLGQQFQGAGYPVLLGTQGNLTIVLLGPYATDAEARQVATQVDGTFGVIDPTVYRFEPEEDAATAPAASAPAATAPAASAPAAATQTSPAPAASAADRYLQVGAYANRESSLPQRERLEGMGFSVSEVQEGTLLKLLVGPYQGEALSDAQGRLAAEGIENFARGL